MFYDATTRNPLSWEYQQLGYYLINISGDEFFEQKNYEETNNMLIKLNP